MIAFDTCCSFSQFSSPDAPPITSFDYLHPVEPTKYIQLDIDVKYIVYHNVVNNMIRRNHILLKIKIIHEMTCGDGTL